VVAAPLLNRDERAISKAVAPLPSVPTAVQGPDVASANSSRPVSVSATVDVFAAQNRNRIFCVRATFEIAASADAFQVAVVSLPSSLRHR
jgi:hypothetical protein